MCTKAEALSILKESYESFKKEFPGRIRDAYLYGSFARGDYDDESDVDILFTVDAEPEEISRYQRELSYINSELSLLHNVTVSATVKSKQLFDQYGEDLPYYKNVRQEVLLYAG